jgi:hypothetical protein
MDFTEDRLRAEDEITRLLFEYCSSIDTGRLDDTARLFEKGSWYLNPDTPFQGIRDMAGFLWENVILYDGVPKTRHVVSNIRIDIDADRPTSARSRSYVIVYQCVEGSVPQIIFQGAYDDTFVRDGQAWRFMDRRIITDGIGDMSKHLKSAQPAGSRTL